MIKRSESVFLQTTERKKITNQLKKKNQIEQK